MQKHILILLTIVLLASSCSLQKRHYRDGYTISFHSKKSQPVKRIHTESSVELMSSANVPLYNENNTTDLVASNNKTIDVNTTKKSKRSVFDEECDKILLRTGDVISAKVIEINSKEVKYKNCNNPDGPLIIINKNTVSKITYKNGYSEEFPVETEPVVTKTVPQKSFSANNSNYGRIDPLAITAFVLAILGFLTFFTFIAGLILGIISESRIKASNGALTGSGFAKASIIISALMILLFLLIIILIISLI